MREFTGLSTAACLTLIGDRLGRPIPAEFEAVYEQRVLETYMTELQPIPGVQAVLEGLTVPACVASGGRLDRVRRALEIVGLADYFGDRLFSSAQVPQASRFPTCSCLRPSKWGQPRSGVRSSKTVFTVSRPGLPRA